MAKSPESAEATWAPPWWCVVRATGEAVWFGWSEAQQYIDFRHIERELGGFRLQPSAWPFIYIYIYLYHMSMFSAGFLRKANLRPSSDFWDAERCTMWHLSFLGQPTLNGGANACCLSGKRTIARGIDDGCQEISHQRTSCWHVARGGEKNDLFAAPLFQVRFGSIFDTVVLISLTRPVYRDLILLTGFPSSNHASFFCVRASTAGTSPVPGPGLPKQ